AARSPSGDQLDGRARYVALPQRQHLARDVLFSHHAFAARERFGIEPGARKGQAVTAVAIAGDVRQPAAGAASERAARDDLLRAAPAGPAETTQRLHLRRLLPGVVYEPVPFGLGRRRIEARLHE